METIETMINPFEYDGEGLINIFNGTVADDDTKHDLQNAQAVGEECFEIFIKENLLTDNPDLFKTLTQNKLQTFVTKKKEQQKKLLI